MYKNARQRAVEAQAQEISMIAMGPTQHSLCLMPSAILNSPLGHPPGLKADGEPFRRSRGGPNEGYK